MGMTAHPFIVEDLIDIASASPKFRSSNVPDRGCIRRKGI